MYCETRKITHSSTSVCTISMRNKSQNIFINILFLLQIIPRQGNGYDCGVFVMEYARHIASNIDMDFTQVNYIRLTLVKFIYNIYIIKYMLI